MKEKQFFRLLLAVKAVLIACCVMGGCGTKAGMTCYWLMVAVYHLSDFFLERRERRL